MSILKQSIKVDATNLQPEHLNPFSRAFNNILSTDLAERTFAQIIDGLPIRDKMGYFPIYSDEIADNKIPSPEAVEMARGVRALYETHITQATYKAAQKYQESIPGSPEFHLRLLELLAVACHDLAGLVYDNTKPGLRRRGQNPEEILESLEGRPTDFMHQDYTAWQQYPKGISDVVGYWAEYHLFGGVVLFDREESGTEVKSVYLHPVGGYKIFQLSETQIAQFSEYVKQLVEGKGVIAPPFPFRAEKVAVRVDPFDAMAMNIFRDRYERIIPSRRPRRCVQRLEDFPDLVDALKEINGRDANR